LEDNEPIRVIVGGMGQSGSTMLFNLIRFCYEDAGATVSSAWITKYIADPQKFKGPVVVLKAHQFSNDIYKYCGKISALFTPVRDLRDVVASAKRRSPSGFNTIEDLTEWARRNVKLHSGWDCWQGCQRTIPRYESYKENPPQFVKDICEVLDLKNIRVDTILDRLETMVKHPDTPKSDAWKSEHFNRTLLSKSHITNQGKVGGYLETLSDEEITALESMFGKWLIAHGYTLAASNRNHESSD